MPPRVLHIFSDHRWTGPAEPVVNLVAELRRQGASADLVIARDRFGAESRVEAETRRRGVEPILDLCLDRKKMLGPPIADVARLRRILCERKIDIVHTHLSHDHVIGALAARLSRRRITIVRTNHKCVALKPTLLNRVFFRALTDAYLGFSPAAAEEDARRFHLDPARVFTTHPAVDLERFNPERTTPIAKQSLGLDESCILGAIVARMQPHRRFDVLLPAIKRAHERCPALRLAIIGRGGRAEQTVYEPRRSLGLEDVVLLPGYRTDDYPDWLSGVDFKIFLVPGSDGTCRAMREAMALGVPVIGARRGAIPEFITDNETGLLIDDTVENLTEAIIRLAEDPALRQRLGDNARARTHETARLETQARDVIAMYEKIAPR